MDLILLTFFNQTIANPVLDWLMIIITLAGFGALPGLGLTLLAFAEQRRVGLGILAALIAGLILAVTFQYLALRPRPDFARHILPAPGVPSFPSGHATAAFSTAIVIILAYRRLAWGAAALMGATLIALSRVYLGVHYPSDLMAGAILGAAVGAASYGLIVARLPGQPIGWGWLLWLQVAVALVITQMAYLDLIPSQLVRWPLADKVFHFLLIGSIAFWLNMWLKGRSAPLGRWAIPLAILIPLILALAEEGVQYFSPIRSASLSDLTSDLLGLLFFWWLSQKLIAQSEPAKYANPTNRTT